ncbi:DNA-formamidopyrimidine glycosylase family protein [Corynebacterium amycolatum]|uniref:DNA-formamidopyrimidine glycosylase family protein n=1 Tax=Corynebacterium amycolatum TaxID=43765 RepID=UPI003B5A7801
MPELPEVESVRRGLDTYVVGGRIDDSGLRVKMCVWLGVSRGLDLAFLNAD